MEETKINNPAQTAGPNLQPAAAQTPAAQSPKQAEDPPTELFFNVMPKMKNAGPMIEAKDKPQAQNPVQPVAAPMQAAAAATPRNYKRYATFAVIVAVAGVGAYFLVTYFSKIPYPAEDILVHAPPPKIPQNPPDQSSQTFGTSSEWRDKYFPNCSDVQVCGDEADPDKDGLTNLDEYNQAGGDADKTGTDPNNPDSDQDGLADGDEVHIFGGSPLNMHTASEPKYSDADFVKGGYNLSNDKKQTAQELAAVSAKIKQFSIHPPTGLTLGIILNSLYKIPTTTPESASSTSTSKNASSTPPAGFDQSAPAKQERDTQRSNSIKNIEVALVSYKKDNGAYPVAEDFASMFVLVKPYLKVATNPLDPVNKDPYLYTYTPKANGTDFTLSFYSEAAGQIIKKTGADAEKDAQAGEAAIYDNQRETDLDTLRTALLLYSQGKVAGNQDYVFPAKDKYKTALVPAFISSIPKDPVSGKDYDYQPSATFDAFTLKATLQNPPMGNTGYICNQVDECTYY